MPHSDDYGLDDDDTEFLAAATQIAVSQHTEEFESDPRPAKKRCIERRLSRGDAAGPEEAPGWSASDDEFQSFPADTTRPVPLDQANSPGGSPDYDEQEAAEYYFPGELGPEDDRGKKSRFRIHQPAVGGRFPDIIVSQTQHDLDRDLTAFRGAVWKRPPPLVPSGPSHGPPLSVMSGNQGTRLATSKGGANGIANYFQSTRPTAVKEDDASLAARLQREEDMFSRQQPFFNPQRHSSAKWPAVDILPDLADLPPDAFSSSSPEKSPDKAVVVITSSQPLVPLPQQPNALRGPQTGLKQMTIFGKAATQDLSTSQAAHKRHAFPLKSKEEPPTHHKLDQKALTTWVFPTNLGTVRDYQYNIISCSLYRNTLVALPTGLGKTFIAATIMLNYYRWTTDAKIIFVAPTKPLIAQQQEACYNIVGIPRSDTILMTGETSPAVRGEEWSRKRVFFMTPQTVINDLKHGTCDPKSVVLLVVDEAHKATGGYAYTEVTQFLRRFNDSFRVLALTATPGSTVEAVQNVIDNLGIAHVEVRTEESIDIRKYTHEKQTETQVFEISEEQARIMGLFSLALQSTVDKLRSQNAYWSKDPMSLNAYALTQARKKWMAEAGQKAPQAIKGMMNAAFTVLSSLAHSISLLKFHGIGPFFSGVLNFQKDVDSGATKGKTAAAIAQHEAFVKMMLTLRAWTNNPSFVGHPKLEYLREVVLGHFLDAGEGRHGSDVPPSATRVMIFASYRDSTEDICRILKRNEPMIRPHVFVGQAASKDSEGMNQKRQNQVIQDFKSGKYNTLVATSIGEEGLDIGTVDLIVCYDASSSPIRMLQRIGRTGRKRLGRVVLLLMSGKEEKDYEKAQDNYKKIQETISNPSMYNYRDDQSVRIIPKDVRPVVDKRPVEIPVENSQPVDLNERGRKGGGKAKKRPPKKFHMPDNVRTGFVRASRLGSDDDQAGHDEIVPKRKTAMKQAKPKTLEAPRPPSPEIARMPFMEDVLLTTAQRDELQRKYAQTSENVDDPIIHAPNPDRYPEKLRDLGPTKLLVHGRRARKVQAVMRAIRAIDNDQIQRMKEALHMSDLEDAGVAQARLVQPRLTDSTLTTAPVRPSGRANQGVVGNIPHNLNVEDLATEPSRAPKAVTKAKGPGRPKKPAAQLQDSIHSVHNDESEIELSHSRVLPPKQAKPRGRPRKKQTIQRTASDVSAAQECAESSPEPTPADMRIGTQGIDLGSRDTSGEDEDEEPDSELEAFLARSSDPIEFVSSSLPNAPIMQMRRGRLNRTKRRASVLTGVDEEENVVSGDESGGERDTRAALVNADAVLNGRARKRRVVEESESD